MEAINTEIKKVVKPSYTPFNRPHYQGSKFCLFLIADLNIFQETYHNEGLYFASLEAGYSSGDTDPGLVIDGSDKWFRIVTNSQLPALDDANIYIRGLTQTREASNSSGPEVEIRYASGGSYDGFNVASQHGRR